MASTLIINSRIVNEGRIIEGDVKIADGRIIKIGGEIRTDNRRIIDADGRFLLPGMIDDQVHFRQPGLTHKGDIASESRAAVAGGITSFMEMPNTIPPTLTMAEVEKKRRLAAENSRANFAFYLGASNGNLEDIKAASPGRIAGVKVFMGASTGNMLVDDEAILSAIFAASPTLIATHCEKMPVIEKNLAAFAGEFSPSSHPQIRNAKACFESSSQAIDLAKKFGARLHILHISTKEELPLFSSDALAGKKITAEACVNHLYFCDEDYESLGNLIKCNPAIKSREDRAAIRAAVAEGRIDVVATDHAPHTLAEKNRPYLNAAAGLPTAQHAMPMLLEMVADGDLNLPTLVRRASHSVADLFAIRERGYIREGYFADLVLVDLATPTEIRRESILAKCGWSPLEGKTLRSSVRMVFVNGEIACDSGKINDAVRGMPLEFAR